MDMLFHLFVNSKLYSYHLLTDLFTENQIEDVILTTVQYVLKITYSWRRLECEVSISIKRRRKQHDYRIPGLHDPTRKIFNFWILLNIVYGTPN